MPVVSPAKKNPPDAGRVKRDIYGENVLLDREPPHLVLFFTSPSL